jgi:alanyl-tRNA synthetase
LEALTAQHALGYLEEQEGRVRDIASVLKVPPHKALSRVSDLVEDRKRLERELNEAKKKLALGGGDNDSADAAGNGGIEEIGNVKFIGKIVKGIAARELKGAVDDAKKSLGSGVVAICAVSEDGKAAIVVGVTDDLTSSYNAVDLVRIASAVVGGKGGGGRPDMAQAGGPDGQKIADALKAIKHEIASSPFLI